RGLGRSIDREDIAFAKQQVVLFADRDFVPGIGTEDDAVAGFESERIPLAILGDVAVADRNYRSLLRLVLGRVGEDDSPGGFRYCIVALQPYAIIQRNDTSPIV